MISIAVNSTSPPLKMSGAKPRANKHKQRLRHAEEKRQNEPAAGVALQYDDQIARRQRYLG
jgi:hypothetical protein